MSSNRSTPGVKSSSSIESIKLVSSSASSSNLNFDALLLSDGMSSDSFFEASTEVESSSSKGKYVHFIILKFFNTA